MMKSMSSEIIASTISFPNTCKEVRIETKVTETKEPLLHAVLLVLQQKSYLPGYFTKTCETKRIDLEDSHCQHHVRRVRRLKYRMCRFLQVRECNKCSDSQPRDHRVTMVVKRKSNKQFVYHFRKVGWVTNPFRVTVGFMCVDLTTMECPLVFQFKYLTKRGVQIAVLKLNTRRERKWHFQSSKCTDWPEFVELWQENILQNVTSLQVTSLYAIVSGQKQQTRFPAFVFQR